MAQTQKVSGRATAMYTDEQGITHIVYHNTRVVSFNGKCVTLRSGGWQTVTTKRRMNQASNQFRLRYTVFQKDYQWFVDLPNGETVPFENGMTFPR